LANPHTKPMGGWVQGPFLNGMMAIGRIPGQERYIESVRLIGDSMNYEVIVSAWVANDHCAPQSWLELYELQQESGMIAPVKAALDEYIQVAESLDDDLDFKSKNSHKWSWCDALYMSPPTFARMAKISGEQKYLDYLHKWWWKVSEYYYDTEEHLYFRDETFFEKREPNGEKVFWSRGNGWVLGGLARVLEYLPQDDPFRPGYEKQLRDMSTRIAEIQCEDGLWRAGLLDTVAHLQPETSGSAFFVYGMAYAINQGIIEKETFTPVVEKAYSALTGFIEENGKFYGIQPIGDKPVNYDNKNSMPYGVGAFLLASSEMYKLILLQRK
jgi:unsaturated rhamnogalacturonyl hydrolase